MISLPQRLYSIARAVRRLLSIIEHKLILFPLL